MPFHVTGTEGNKFSVPLAGFIVAYCHIVSFVLLFTLLKCKECIITFILS